MLNKLAIDCCCSESRRQLLHFKKVSKQVDFRKTVKKVRAMASTRCIHTNPKARDILEQANEPLTKPVLSSLCRLDSMPNLILQEEDKFRRCIISKFLEYDVEIFSTHALEKVLTPEYCHNSHHLWSPNKSQACLLSTLALWWSVYQIMLLDLYTLNHSRVPEMIWCSLWLILDWGQKQ